MAKSIAGVKWIRARQSVATQLNVLTAEGMAIASVVTMKAVPTRGFMPLVNMWWPHTRKLRNAMAQIDATIALYPKIGLRPWTARISAAIPVGGGVSTYDTGR